MNPSNWIQPLPPVAGAYEVNFAQEFASGVVGIGQRRSVTLAGVGLQSPGEWTLYFLRLCYLEEPDLATGPALLTKIMLQVGTDKGRGDLLGLERATASAGGNVQTGNALFRGVAFHIVGGQIDATIEYQSNGRATDDRLLAWVSPGRPQVTRLEGRATTAPTTVALARAARMRVPAFSRRITVMRTTDAAPVSVNPQIIFFQGPTVVTAFYLPATAVLSTTSSTYVVPQEATHMAFLDVAGPPGGEFVYFQYEIEQ
jgi:hypothetical protein